MSLTLGESIYSISKNTKEDNIYTQTSREPHVRNLVPKEFEEFWQAYPRRVGRGAAEKSFAKAMKFTDLPTILTAIKNQRSGWTDPQYIPHPATWLNQRRWLDETRPVAAPPQLVLIPR